MCLHHAKCREREDLDMVPDLQELWGWWRRSKPCGVCRNVIWHAGLNRGTKEHVSASPGDSDGRELMQSRGQRVRRSPAGEEGRRHSLGEGQLHNVRLGLEGGLVITASRLLSQLRRKRPQRWPLHQSLPPVEGPEVAPAPGPQCDGFSISRRL